MLTTIYRNNNELKIMVLSKNLINKIKVLMMNDPLKSDIISEKQRMDLKKQVANITMNSFLQ